jgi:Restriction Enzyme Adenine Methylase Associated
LAQEKEQSVGPSRKIRAKYKGKFVKAQLRGDKRVRMKGKLYGSPSAAASAIGKRAINGWSFWHYERGPGDWVPIDELRNV